MADLHDDSINLRALKKIDENIQEIQLSAGQVAIYYFDTDDNIWKRKEIEGPLFFVRRCVQPEYAFVVINKLNTINLVQKITKDLETNLQNPYLMYKNTKNDIYCVWFYDKENSNVLNDKIIEIIENMKKNQLFSHSINQFNGLNSNNSSSTQTDLLKKLIKYNPNPQNGENKIVPTQTTNEIIKPSTQRCLNLKDLFDLQLNISNNSNETSTPIKTDGDKILTPYQFLKDEKNKKNYSPNTSLLNKSIKDEANDLSKTKNPIEALFQNQKLTPNTSNLEPKIHKTSDSENPLYLSMEQLKKTLVYLLQNDADFLHTIHTTYVESIKK